MKSIDFAYWLQGWFELTDNATISARQTAIIKSHLELVMKYDNAPSQFCHSLNGLFTIINLQEFNETQTEKLKEQLSDTFLNEIDTRYSAEEHQRLDRIHRRTDDEHIGIGHRFPDGSVAKC
jgi:hypothetical protein